MAIEYRITLDDNHQFSYRIELDRVYEAEVAQSAPAWTRLEYQQCSNCPLSKDNFSHCPAAVDLHRVVRRVRTRRAKSCRQAPGLPSFHTSLRMFTNVRS